MVRCGAVWRGVVWCGAAWRGVAAAAPQNELHAAMLVDHPAAYNVRYTQRGADWADAPPSPTAAGGGGAEGAALSGVDHARRSADGSIIHGPGPKASARRHLLSSGSSLSCLGGYA